MMYVKWNFDLGTPRKVDTICDCAADDAQLPASTGGGVAHAAMYDAAETIMRMLGGESNRQWQVPEKTTKIYALSSHSTTFARAAA